MLQENDNKITVLERRLGDLTELVNAQTADIQTINEKKPVVPVVTQSNALRNGDADLSRNDYLYLTDVTGTAGVDADVSKELFGWYSSPKDASIEAVGSISSAGTTLTITTADFVSGDATKEIVVAGAGAAGADLVTTIATFTDTTHVELTAAAGSTVSGARVRWRLTTFKEDSTDEDADADQTTNTTIKSSDHSLFASTVHDPYWDKGNGWITVSGTNWIAQPLKQNIVRPSLHYIISFIYALDAGDDLLTDMFVGIWDNSPGKKCFLEGDAITLTAAVQGSPASTVSTDYFVVFYTNWGETIGSQVKNVNAPVTFTNTEYVALEWSQPAGIIATEIYRKVGGTVYLLNPPYPQSSYKDKGATRQTLGAFPSVDKARPRAYMQTNRHNISPAKTDWQTAQFNLPIPSSYNASKTTDKQWFVIGLVDATTGQKLQIDRISMDDKPGIFSRSPWDSDAKRDISSHPTSGNIGGFGGGIDPGGTGYCPVFDTPIEVEVDGQRFEVPAIELVDNEDIYRIVNRDGIADEYEATISPEAQIVMTLSTGAKKLTASLDHPVFTEDNYLLMKYIGTGTIILTKTGLVEVESNLRQPKRRHTVKISLKGVQKGYWANGIGCHNNKPVDPLTF